MRKRQTDGNLALAGYGDIFGGATGVGIADGESVQEIALYELYPPEFHPFKVTDDEAMKRLVESVKQDGVREPGLARKRAEGGGYELLCGNRRKMACELAGIDTMPVIVRELDDDRAAIFMVDSNLLTRERILPSERAAAYKVKMDALNHNGVKGEAHSYEVMKLQTGESKNQIFRLIRLTELIAGLIDKVDVKKLAFNPAVALSYLSILEQTAVAEAMERYEVKPSLSQATRLKKMKQDGTLTEEVIDAIFGEEKKPPKNEMADETKGAARFKKFFPPEYSRKQMDEVIVTLLTNWKSGVAV
ncbi:hypothetical protein FACS18949_16830 [Clostridia bacterium]|nr:hypothetical protein FACS189425_02390 [Clostridia bacterium]GHV36914.1 hypothetical protein FACS18949_16830 [Clostridia bacterium]